MRSLQRLPSKYLHALVVVVPACTGSACITQAVFGPGPARVVRGTSGSLQRYKKINKLQLVCTEWKCAEHQHSCLDQDHRQRHHHVEMLIKSSNGDAGTTCPHPRSKTAFVTCAPWGLDHGGFYRRKSADKRSLSFCTLSIRVDHLHNQRRNSPPTFNMDRPAFLAAFALMACFAACSASTDQVEVTEWTKSFPVAAAAGTPRR